MDHFYERHVLHSLGIAKTKLLAPDSHILDVGTGGGFPGIPLAILFPDAQFLLVDSIGKKIKVVREIAKEIKLTNVEAEHIRAEEVNGKFDFVVSRAVTRLNPFIGWIKTKVIKGTPQHVTGVLYLKGGELEEELAEVHLPKVIFKLPDYFSEEFFETKKVVYIPF